MVDSAAVELIIQRLVERYSNPGRTAYLYMFRLIPGTEFESLIPPAPSILQAWVDEGDGLTAIAVEVALTRCAEALKARVEHPTNAHERRQQMARLVSFSVSPQTASQVVVELASRALLHTPKGDRRVTEIWHPAEGTWYSVPVGSD